MDTRRRSAARLISFESQNCIFRLLRERQMGAFWLVTIGLLAGLMLGGFAGIFCMAMVSANRYRQMLMARDMYREMVESLKAKQGIR
jgi:hypothetical protein